MSTYTSMGRFKIDRSRRSLDLTAARSGAGHPLALRASSVLLAPAHETSRRRQLKRCAAVRYTFRGKGARGQANRSDCSGGKAFQRHRKSVAVLKSPSLCKNMNCSVGNRTDGSRAEILILVITI
jgi:hypothetical protein